MNSLSNKVAIVTGASSGLGWATTVAFASQGTRVVLTARREDRLIALVQEIVRRGGNCMYVAGDAALETTAERTINECLRRFGQIDFLISNAGQGNYKQLVDTSADEYDEMMNSNMRSSFVFSRLAAPHMIEQRSGTIVFVSSVAGLRGTGNEAVYSASKFAQIGFAQGLDEELSPYGIKVCTFCPGGMKTEFAIGRGRTESDVADSNMMEPQEVAQSILFLCRQPENVRAVQMTVRNMWRQK